MTTNETRDLDRTCAEAMGWTNIQDGHFIGERFGLRPGSTAPWVLPRYSTDPNTQAEKLAWLRANIALDEWVEIYNRDDWVALIWSEWAEHAQEGPGGAKMPRGEGATIDEALARLICCISRKTK